jgi:hypothetical protein
MRSRRSAVLLIIGCLVAQFLNNGCSEEVDNVTAPRIGFYLTPNTYAIVHVTRITCIPMGKGEGLKFAWDFGDGYRSEETRPSHVYTREGEFNITMTATDRAGVSVYEYYEIIVGNLNGMWAKGGPADTYFELVQTGASLTGTDYENGQVIDSLVGRVSDPKNVTWKNSYSEFSGAVDYALSRIDGTVRFNAGGVVSTYYVRR